MPRPPISKDAQLSVERFSRKICAGVALLPLLLLATSTCLVRPPSSLSPRGLELPLTRLLARVELSLFGRLPGLGSSRVSPTDSGFTYQISDFCESSWVTDKHELRMMLIDKGLWDAVNPATNEVLAHEDVTRAQQKALAALYVSLGRQWRLQSANCTSGTQALVILSGRRQADWHNKRW